MDEKLVEVLVNREGYNDKRAALAVVEAERMGQELMCLLKNWIDDANNMQDFVCHNISLLYLKEKKKMNYLGALLTMDWLIKEPEIAKPVIESLL